MVDIALGAQAVSSLQAAYKLVKTLIGVRDAALIEAKMVELRDHITEAQGSLLQSQAQQSSLIQEVHDLKQKLMKLDSWEQEKQRYQLVTPWSGFYVFAIKESNKGTDPAHWICPSCYEKGRKEYLYFMQVHTPYVQPVVKCHACSLEMKRKTWDEMQYAERYAEKAESKGPTQNEPISK